LNKPQLANLTETRGAISPVDSKLFIPALTGLRAFAALGVVLFHFTRDANLHVSIFDPIVGRGYLGVDLFFVLSGFIIHHVYRGNFPDGVKGSAYIEFIRNRFARIYPVHLLTMIVMLAFFGAGSLILHRTPEDPSASTVSAILASLFLVQGWLNIPSPNLPAWTVSAEWFGYLLYPCIAFRTARLGTASRIAIAICAVPAIEFLANGHPLLRICPEFLLGMMVYDLRLGLSFGRAGRFVGWFVTGLFVACIYLFPNEHLGVDAAFFAILITALSNNADKLGRLLALPIIVYLGEISYSIYLTHGPVWAFIKNMARLVGVEISSPLLIGTTVLLVIFVSAATFRYVELPARQALRVGRRSLIEAHIN
jgi:peptidoglycan/LPS O-acetylase OafA/YrhL